MKRISHPETRVAGPPKLVLSSAGAFQLVEPLACPSDEIVTQQRALEITRGPNIATFVVGVIATAVGGVMLVRGTTAEDASNPFTYGGAALLAGGLPFAFGPWIGNHRELSALDAGAPVTRPGPSEPCGEQPHATVPATTLRVRGISRSRGAVTIEVFGSVGRDGTISVSPFTFVDAFNPESSAWNITANIGARTIEATFEGRAFAGREASVGVDPRIEPLRLVPNLVPGPLRISLTQTASGPAARIVLAIKNEGPGPTYRLRGRVEAPGLPALDGRIIYFGLIEKASTVTGELLVPLAPAAAEALRNATIDLALELHDAHATAPQTPVRFRGALLVDAPR